ncbi:MAG: NTP transferase domain-containing protein [Xanthomonadales bacterium]|nr:NTP transferase domain-containing protein [Xanthomonadales bacterium]
MAAPLPIGLILAGGRGSRFGGTDKAWLRLHGQPLLCHCWQTLGEQVQTIVVASQRHRWAYRRLGIQLIDDHAAAPGHGPLAAIAGALARWPQRRIAVLPVDAPFAPADYVARLDAVLGPDVPAAAVFDGQRRQPLFALVSGQLAAHAVQALQAPVLPSMRRWLDDVGAIWVDFSDAVVDLQGDPQSGSELPRGLTRGAFANINTPADLDRLARLMSEDTDG